MTTATPGSGGSLRAPRLGAAWWSATVAAAGAGLGELTLVDAMTLLAVVVIVPAAIPLHPAGGLRASAAATLAGLPVAPALLIDRGTLAGALSVPWILAAGFGAFAAARWWWTRETRVRQIIWPAAAAYLVVGSLWLLADRLDFTPGGFAAPLVQLTSVHFHYAGFASLVLAGSAWRWCPHSRTAATAAILILAAPPIVASGFAFLGLLQIIGAALLALGLWLLAWVTVRHVAPQVNRVAGSLLVVSSIAVLVPMGASPYSSSHISSAHECPDVALSRTRREPARVMTMLPATLGVMALAACATPPASRLMATVNIREAAATRWFWLEALFLPLGMTDSEVVAPPDFGPTRRGLNSGRLCGVIRPNSSRRPNEGLESG